MVGKMPGDTAIAASEADAMDRARLIALDRGQPILVAEAPSGYGKTVFARSWVRHAPPGTRTIWVSLDAAVRDPTVFLERLAAAVGTPVAASIGSSADDDAGRSEIFARIAAGLSDEAAPIRLVLDDAHHLAEGASRAYLERLLQGASPRLRILLTVQPVDLHVGLGELTALGKVGWLNAAALALVPAEIDAYARARGSPLEPGQAKQLADATQGWPALVQLALVASPDSPPRLGDIGGLGPVREFLYERFFARLASGERELLWNLSCVGAAPLRLLDALAAPPSRPQLDLKRLLALGVVQPVEPAAEATVQVHPLMRAAARKFLDPDHAPGRDARLVAAARWFWSQGRGADAAQTLLEADGPGHLQQAREWIAALAEALIFRQGHHQTLLDLVVRWETVAGRVDPGLNAAAVWALIFQRRFAAAEDRLTASSDAPADEASLQRGTIAALRDDYETGGRLAHDWLQARPREPSFHTGAAWTVHAFHLKCRGEIDAALAALRHAHDDFSRSQSGYGTVWAYVVGTLSQIRGGRYRDALAEIERGLAHCGNAPGFGGQRAMLRGLEAFVRYERNELPAARACLDEAMPLLHTQGIVDAIVLGFTAAARLRAATHDLGAALDILSEGERSGIEREFFKLSVSLRAERALILVRTGATGQARRLCTVAALGAAEATSAGLARDRIGRLQARLDIAEGGAARALASLTPLIAHAREAQQQYKLAELLVLAALAEDALDREAQAYPYLREALELGRSECYLRLFVDEGAELQDLLGRWLRASGAQRTHRSEAAWAETVLETAGSVQASSAFEGEAPFEALNRRERQFLALLEEGLSNAEIAARCFIGEGTVKWHLHNLYTKFGVRSRTAVLRAARERGVLGR